MRALKWICVAVTVSLTTTLGGLTWYISQPPEIGRLNDLSRVLRSSEGHILNLSLTKNGYWREPVTLSDVDPKLIDLLVAYEDQRFWEHKGVDLKAIARASGDLLKFGKITSGASTLTMQTVRLLDNRLRERTVAVKIRQMVEAVRLDAHWTKEEILEAYFTLAPYGGNIEGIKAATEAWFQKSPTKLTLNEMAMLVALPQSPERRRPDRFPKETFIAKQIVLTKVGPRLNLDASTVGEVLREPLPARLFRPSSHALHLAQRLSNHKQTSYQTSLHKNWQRQIENILASEIKSHREPIQAAAMVVERKTGLVRAYVGSAEYGSETRKGAINYLTALRSPGSTLKPLIYAKALNRGLITYDHVFDDTALFKSGYRPTNFNNSFSGKVGLKEALLASLNIPAIRAIEQVGPDLLQSELDTYLDGALNSQKDAGLSLAVGGLYLTPEQLISIYMGIMDPGYAKTISFEAPALSSQMTLISKSASDQILSLLIQEMSNGERVAFKTGTSYARQDAWSIQIYERHIVLVWLGTPDNESTSHLTGAGSAFPVSLAIGRSLGLRAPHAPQLSSANKAKSLQPTAACPNLIDYPQDQTWIKSSTQHIKVIGASGSQWFLNGQKIEGDISQVKILEPGINKLSALRSNCSQTHEFFVHF